MLVLARLWVLLVLEFRPGGIVIESTCNLQDPKNLVAVKLFDSQDEIQELLPKRVWIESSINIAYGEYHYF